VVDVVDEEIERVDALLEAALDRGPCRRADDPGHQIEWKDALRALSVAVHVERDAHVSCDLQTPGTARR
jgi:hypothetical protein